jgi:uncharacterized protein/uncharacterized membrane protein
MTSRCSATVLVVFAASSPLLCSWTTPARAQLASQPSFSCISNTAPNEQAICNSQILSALDRQLSNLFASALQARGPDEQAALRKEQRTWLTQRASCLRDVDCIADAYHSRIAELDGGRTQKAGQSQNLKLTLIPDTTTQLLEKCGSSCPDDPTADKLRTETQEKWEQQNLAAQEAQTFAEALGDPRKLLDYFVSCKICEFQADADGELATLRKAEADSGIVNRERDQYTGARGNIQALKKYVADCQVCTFAGAAVQEINQATSIFEGAIFKVEVCNNEYLPVYVAYAGRPDPNSSMWVANGWYKVNSGECSIIASLAKGNFYLNANNRRGVWTGDDARGYCTSRDAFTRVLLQQDDECSDDEQITQFGKKHFEGSGTKFTWTLDAKPWTYSAVAYSPLTSSWGWSTGYSSEQEAEDQAIAGCSKNAFDCRVGSWARDDVCLALASGPNGNGDAALGWATGDDCKSARTKAIQFCAEYSESCSVIKQSAR